jgi:hypothetical protein
MTSGPGGVGQQHSEPLHPPEHGDVVDLDTTLNQEFLDVAVGQVVAQVPAHRDDDRLGWEPEPDERRLWGCQGPGGRSTPSPVKHAAILPTLNATEPAGVAQNP